MFLATKHNCTDSLKVLLESGANPNIFTKVTASLVPRHLLNRLMILVLLRMECLLLLKH